MRESFDSRLTEAQQLYNSDHDKYVYETPVFTTNKLLFVDRALISLNISTLKTADQPTYKKLMSRADRPYRILWLQQHTLNIDENGVTNTISMRNVASARSHNTNSRTSREQSVITGTESIVNSRPRLTKEMLQRASGKTETIDTHIHRLWRTEILTETNLVSPKMQMRIKKKGNS